MRVAECCTKKVIVTPRSTGITDAARLMREHHVGALVVAEEGIDDGKPIGIVTDRDLVVEILAKDIDAAEVAVGDVMSPDLCVAKEGEDVFQALDRMRQQGVRRVPVVDDDGFLVGVLSVDDVLTLLASGFSCIPQLMKAERNREAAMRM